MLTRARAIDASLSMVGIFLRDTDYELREIDQLQDRSASVNCTKFDLELIDDTTYLRNLRFKEVIYKIEQVTDWSSEMSSMKRRRYITNFLFSLCVIPKTWNC